LGLRVSLIGHGEAHQVAELVADLLEQPGEDAVGGVGVGDAGGRRAAENLAGVVALVGAPVQIAGDGVHPALGLRRLGRLRCTPSNS
jgi:hypothetical protein